MKIRSLAIFLLLLLLVGVGVGGYFFRVHKIEEDQVSRIDSIADSADDVVDRVRNTLNSSLPVIRIYDREMNYLTTIATEDAVQVVSNVPSPIKDTILSKCNIYTTVALSMLDTVNQERVSTEELVAGYALRLQNDFSADDLVKYVATTGVFGQYTGLVTAASSLFGVKVDDLSEEQLSYLAYSFGEVNNTVDSYLASTPGVAKEDLNLVEVQFDYSALKSLIVEELQNILGSDLNSNSYNVQITLSTSQQNRLQSFVDSDMKQFMTLNSNGSYQIDCSVLVVDNVGRVKAYVPRRSTNQRVSDVFKLNCLNFTDNYLQLLSEMQKPNSCWLTLREVAGSAGLPSYRSVVELFKTLSLSDSKAVDYLSPKDVFNLMYTEDGAESGMGIIHEVQTTDGVTVYKCSTEGTKSFDLIPTTGVTPESGEDNPNYKVYEMFSEDTNGHTQWGFDLSTYAGMISFHRTSNYTVAIVIGSSVLGVNLSDSEKTNISNFVSKLIDTVDGEFSDAKRALWPTGLEHLIDEAYITNTTLLSPLFQQQYNLLLTLEVDSSESRHKWEENYKALIDFISQYQPYLSPSTVSAWTSQVDVVRKSMADVLLRYST